MNTETKRERFMRLAEVIECTGISQKSIYRKMKTGEFPQNVNLGGRNVGWLESEIDQWMANIIKQRQAKQEERNAN